jgi:hypothetical protein
MLSIKKGANGFGKAVLWRKWAPCILLVPAPKIPQWFQPPRQTGNELGSINICHLKAFVAASGGFRMAPPFTLRWYVDFISGVYLEDSGGDEQI